MLQQHAGAETTAESSTEDVCRREIRQLIRVSLETYSSCKKGARREIVVARREYLWPRVANIPRRHLATQAASACSEKSFFKGRFDMC